MKSGDRVERWFLIGEVWTMPVFIYKRTHTGDPDKNGCFGIEDCMGEKRSWEYDAVIGIGGRGAEAESYGIDRKVNWIGIGRIKSHVLDHGR